MRQIRFILVNDSSAQVSGGESRRGHVSNRGYHFTISRKGLVNNLFSVRKPGVLFGRKTLVTDRYNQSSIGVWLGGPLEGGGPEARAALIRLLVDLRYSYPNAKILGFSEISGDYFRVSAAMNRLRLELSDMP